MPDNDSWEKAYESGEYKHWEFSYPFPELVALVAAHVLRRNTRILDVGCGGGADAVFMAQCGFKVTGVDISVSALRIARKREEEAHVKVNWLRGSVLELPINSGSIDLVTDRGLLHLIKDNDRLTYASEIFRVLKKGGRVLIRGASIESGHDQFNAITEEAIDRFFPNTEFNRGPVLAIPLFSVEGSMDARIVMLRKTGS